MTPCNAGMNDTVPLMKVLRFLPCCIPTSGVLENEFTLVINNVVSGEEDRVDAEKLCISHFHFGSQQSVLMSVLSG
jgi:hypothetical protein